MIKRFILAKVADLKRFANHRYRVGWLAEQIAAGYLVICGYRLVARNQRRLAEVDILACKGKVLVLVEVKARQTRGAAHTALSPAQRERLLRQATQLLGQYQVEGIRCDAILCYPKWPFLEHIQDAW